MLVELGLVEQRYRAVLEVLNDGASVTEVARRYGVVRQTVHAWLRRYATGGLGALADGSSRPATCPHQMTVEVEAKIVAFRRAHPTWGPRTIRNRLAREGIDPLPARSSVYRALVRHRMIDPKRRRRRRSDYKRWERSRAMELWQMDVTGGVCLADGAQASVVTGLDDHSRFCVSAKVVARATAKPVCDALAEAMRVHGVPEAILTDNGKVFTGRFGPGSGEVLFDRICRENGIKHLLTAPHSPTTTGKVERFHRTPKDDLVRDVVFDSIDDAQARIDAWVEYYNHQRPHQGIGMVPPVQRFRLANPEASVLELDGAAPDTTEVTPTTTRRVSGNGQVSFAATRYMAGRWLAGETVELVCEDGLLAIHHRGVLIATHARRHDPGRQAAAVARGKKRRASRTVTPRPSLSAVSVTRKVDSSGNVSFAGSNYRVGNKFRRRQVQVAVVDGAVEISIGEELIRVHPIRHDRTREHGALANPGGRPNRINAAS